ncbi:hypothetical protein [Paracoccus yeei]|uniref:Uncharacterized protein n=1 Tax=Paracoccus yeei TaxID=147645 RepID=A0A5P2QLZ5_9RHOB|nr:hypothetical protein [Paracoccus yeei]QEU06988.1 hypothetical protein FOB51_02615 [Paracoccus yeei]
MKGTFCNVDNEEFLAVTGVNSVVSHYTTGQYAPQASSGISPDNAFNLTRTNAERVGGAITVPNGFDSCLIAVDTFMSNKYAKARLFPISLYLRFLGGDLNYTGTANAWN